MIFTWLDDQILAGCTKFAHWTQSSFGITNFRIAKFGRFLCFVWLALKIINRFRRFMAMPTYGMDLFMAIIVAPLMAWEGSLCDRAEHSLYNSDALDIHRLLQFSGRPWRLLWLVMFALDAAVRASGMLFSFGCLLFFYFITVIPLPPGRSKIREWLRNFFVRQVPATEKA
jgi:hypothetical protein